MEEILRLFKGYLGEKDNTYSEKALAYGLLISNNASDSVINEAIKQYGKDGEKWNQTFHKSWDKVANAPIEQLIAEQIVHYFTTYGFESLGVYSEDTVYIPSEKLEIPELESGLELVVIKAMSEEELQERLMVLLTSGIALSEQTVKDVMVLSNYIDKDRFDEINNREIKTALYDKYNIMPRDPEEFLRYLIFKTTGSTLKIKNRALIEQIKNCDRVLARNMLKSYVEKTPNGYNRLASIFLRNKPLFLAYKCDNKQLETSKIINKLRKLAKTQHKPLGDSILDNLTNPAKYIDIDQLLVKLDSVTIYREIRMLNAILYRINGNKNIVYKIRNGKSYVSTLKDYDTDYVRRLLILHDEIKQHLTNRVKEKVNGKNIYIPNGIVYTLPTSEKQFNGNIPEGSYIDVPKDSDLVYGVYWKNLGRERVDLDLKQMNKAECFGWDASYRSSSVSFSGDMTDACGKGASELFMVRKGMKNKAYLITLNLFTDNSEDVPFEFVIAKADKEFEICKYYTLNPNNILYKFDNIIKRLERQMVVGFIKINEDDIRFYFNDFSAGVSTCTSSRNEITMGAFDYLNSYSESQLKLNSFLKDCGANIVDKPVIEKDVVKMVDGVPTLDKETTPVDIDLSPEHITKETIIGLLN